MCICINSCRIWLCKQHRPPHFLCGCHLCQLPTCTESGLSLSCHSAPLTEASSGPKSKYSLSVSTALTLINVSNADVTSKQKNPHVGILIPGRSYKLPSDHVCPLIPNVALLIIHKSRGWTYVSITLG